MGFGGGYGILPLIREELVERKKILNIEDFHRAIARAQSIPGPIAVNTSIFIGLDLFGIFGAIILVLGVTIPPLFAIILIAILIDKFESLSILHNFLKGARIAIVVIIIDFALRLSKRNLKDLSSLAVVVAGVFLTFMFKIPVILSFLISAAIIYTVNKIKDVRADVK
jgi:chromate transporter